MLFILACSCFLSGKTNTKPKTEPVVVPGYWPTCVTPMNSTNVLHYMARDFRDVIKITNQLTIKQRDYGWSSGLNLITLTLKSGDVSLASSRKDSERLKAWYGKDLISHYVFEDKEDHTESMRRKWILPTIGGHEGGLQNPDENCNPWLTLEFSLIKSQENPVKLFWTSDLLKCEIINRCCFKLLYFW